TNTSAAHRERVFLEQRLNSVRAGLEQAELNLSRFSSKSSAIDIKEQTRAIVDAGARLQAQLLIEQSGLESLRQIYGDGNVRVRQSEARIASLKKQLAGLAGSSDRPDDSAGSPDIGLSSETRNSLYPPLRQIPRLAVPYADLYRRVRVEEAVFELLNQQYEMARIEEAKDIPTVSVIDAPGIPEKKAFPPRLLLALLLTFLSFVIASAFLLARHHWSTIHPDDPRKLLAAEVLPVLRRRSRSILRWKRAPVRRNSREAHL
ncbi:MAG: lipopolysaccharide biosynthesis protein, partial [Acidobacteriaceae bacterium]